MARKVLAGLALSLFTAAAHAYVGPGLGLGVLGALFGIIAAAFLAVVGVIWYPVKRILAKLRGGRGAGPGVENEAGAGPPGRDQDERPGS